MPIDAQGTSRTRLDSPWLPAVITAAAYLLFLLARLHTQGWNPYAFISAGDKFCDRSRVPSRMPILENSPGYDGQFFYCLALDPFTKKVADFGITLDLPLYRNQRIIYPLLAWALSLGRPGLVPISLIVVNYLGLCLIAWFGARIAQLLDRHALWGLAFSLYPGFLFTLSRDLSEIVQVAFLLATLLLLRRERPIAATIAAILAILTRETAILVVLAAAMVYGYEGWRSPAARRTRWYFFVLPLLAYALWRAFLLARWGGHTPLIPLRYLTMPFSGAVGFIAGIATFVSPEQVFCFFGICLLAALAVAVLSSWRSSSATALEKTAWLLCALLNAVLPHAVWIEDWGFMRTHCEYYVLGAVILIGSRSSLKSAIFGGAGAMWLTLCLAQL